MTATPRANQNNKRKKEKRRSEGVEPAHRTQNIARVGVKVEGKRKSRREERK